MSLQRRLIVAVLVAAPFAWLLTMTLIYRHALHEIDELYDTDMVMLARQVHAVFSLTGQPAMADHAFIPPSSLGDQGEASLKDWAIAVWTPDERRLYIGAGVRLPFQQAARGFMNLSIEGMRWRLYYLRDDAQGWRIAVGQRIGERRELVASYVVGQMLPWALGLPLLLGLLIWSVRWALRPLRKLSTAIEQRAPADATPLSPDGVSGELSPLVGAMNRLFSRITETMAHERRLIADAAHELRTPLAALQAQWEVANRARDPQERRQAQANVGAGIERLNRLVSQLLAMARLENAAPPTFTDEISWPRLAQRALSDCLWLADQRHIEVELFFPPAAVAPLPLVGNEHLLEMMLRNLLDNAIRYGAERTTVTMHFHADRLVIENAGQGVPAEQLARLGDRFFRAPGQNETGSGLGLSIARRVAGLHGLVIGFENRLRDGEVTGFAVTVRRA